MKPTPINDNLEAMARQLYDYWFVQFDFPNEDGKPYKSSGGAMVWKEKLKREIPQGWSTLPISAILDKYPTTKRYETKEYLSQGKYPIRFINLAISSTVIFLIYSKFVIFCLLCSILSGLYHRKE